MRIYPWRRFRSFRRLSDNFKIEILLPAGVAWYKQLRRRRRSSDAWRVVWGNAWSQQHTLTGGRRSVPTRRTPKPGEEVREQQTLYLRPGLRRRLRIAAAILDVEISNLVDDALTGHLEALSAQRVAQGHPPLPDD